MTKLTYVTVTHLGAGDWSGTPQLATELPRSAAGVTGTLELKAGAIPIGSVGRAVATRNQLDSFEAKFDILAAASWRLLISVLAVVIYHKHPEETLSLQDMRTGKIRPEPNSYSLN